MHFLLFSRHPNFGEEPEFYWYPRMSTEPISPKMAVLLVDIQIIITPSGQERFENIS